MDISDKIERYKDLFKDDPLFQEIKRRNLLDKLFEPCLLYERVIVDSTLTYSTKQATELLEIKGREQTLLNFLNRNDLKSYIQIHRQGSRGYYRYDYKTLFQFKMILMLTDLELTPSDIATIAGTRPEYGEYYERRSQNMGMHLSTPSNIQQQIQDEVEEQLRNSFIALNHQLQKKDSEIFELKMDSYRKQIEILEKELIKWEKEMRDTIETIQNADINISMHEIYLESLKNPNKVSIFGIKFKGKPEQNILDKIKILESKLEEFKLYRIKLNDKKKELEKEKIDIVSKHQVYKDELQKMEQTFLEKFKIQKEDQAAIKELNLE